MVQTGVGAKEVQEPQLLSPTFLILRMYQHFH